MLKKLSALALVAVMASQVIVCAETVAMNNEENAVVEQTEEVVVPADVAAEIEAALAKAEAAGISKEEAVKAVAEALIANVDGMALSATHKKEVFLVVAGVALGVVCSFAGYKIYTHFAK